ncbi:MAG: 50S ribosomal protein L11 methyltransferase [bacterium]|jgi:ribosomal protein L11 methyltransferase
MRYIEIFFKDVPEGKIDLLVAILPDYGFSGMEELSDGLKAYSSEQEADTEGIKAFADSHTLRFITTIIEEQNWNETWESNFDPVILPGKIHVRAHFHAPIIDVEHEIVITPKMSFGTGHHATTMMMMKAMLDIDLVDSRVIDFGTGTGILAILAEKLGAREIDAIDNDQWSINNAEENVLNNKGVRINTKLLDSLTTLAPANLILANINKSILLSNLNDIHNKVLPGGKIIISGLLSIDYDEIIDAYQQNFGDPVGKYSENGWIAFVFEKGV